ncbi:MAG: hypothetical protein JNK87_29340 [Bryobacterales bacterium]|nr:hypothetical protein [Bryobacterales bacterium]
MAFHTRPVRLSYPASAAAAFSETSAQYRYDGAPLRAKVAVEEKEAWRREEIAFDGALPGDSLPGRPGLVSGVRVTQMVEDRAGRMAPFLKEGRAVFLVVLEGFAGREPVGAYGDLAMTSTDYREMLREWSVDTYVGGNVPAERGGRALVNGFLDDLMGKAVWSGH